MDFGFEPSRSLLSIRGLASFENESWVAFSSFEMLFMFSPYSPTFFIMAICKSLMVSSIWVSRFSISMVWSSICFLNFVKPVMLSLRSCILSSMICVARSFIVSTSMLCWGAYSGYSS